jgi:hypothetical protein
MREHPYTTAYLSARILGKAGPQSISRPCGRPWLRRITPARRRHGGPGAAQGRPDRARHRGDRGGGGKPRIIVQGAYALELLRSVTSVPPLVEVLRKETTPDFVLDEAVLSLAAILGVFDKFYPCTGVDFDPDRGHAMLQTRWTTVRRAGTRRNGRRLYGICWKIRPTGPPPRGSCYKSRNLDPGPRPSWRKPPWIRPLRASGIPVPVGGARGFDGLEGR